MVMFDLEDNLLAVTTLPVTEILVHGFYFQLLGVGAWQVARAPVEEAMRRIVATGEPDEIGATMADVILGGAA